MVIKSDSPLQTVLVADDDPTIHALFRRILVGDQIRLLTCLDGEKALELAQSSAPDLIFLDVLMPKMDGLDVCKILRTMPGTAVTPILFLSGRAADRLKGLDLGANDYLLKPVDIAELRAKCRTYLRLSTLQKQFIEMERRRAVTGLLRGLAHQFNNILCGLSGAAQVLDLRVPAGSNLRDNCKTIVQYSQRAATLSQQLLVLAGARREVGECRTQEMVESTRTAWEAAQAGTSRDHRIEIDCLIPADTRIAMGAADFQTCLFHLMQNAIHSMTEPGSVRLDFALAEDRLRVSLTDRGRGMSQLELQQALEPFVQNRDRPADAGLGLPFVRALLEEAGGSLRMESTRDVGTTAILTLPLRR